MERITGQTSIKSDIDKVREYWTKPEHITKWNLRLTSGIASTLKMS
jgi:uncharacterized protein YndB with AHSA1/START domain